MFVILGEATLSVDPFRLARCQLRSNVASAHLLRMGLAQKASIKWIAAMVLAVSLFGRNESVSKPSLDIPQPERLEQITRQRFCVSKEVYADLTACLHSPVYSISAQDAVAILIRKRGGKSTKGWRFHHLSSSTRPDSDNSV